MLRFVLFRNTPFQYKCVLGAIRFAYKVILKSIFEKSSDNVFKHVVNWKWSSLLLGPATAEEIPVIVYYLIIDLKYELAKIQQTSYLIYHIIKVCWVGQSVFMYIRKLAVLFAAFNPDKLFVRPYQL